MNLTSAAAAVDPQILPIARGVRRLGDYSSLTVVIPTLNEVGAISELLSRVVELMPGCRVVVADDGSTDGTQNAVRIFAQSDAADGDSCVTLLDRSSKAVHGITASVLDALQRCQTDYIAVIDGDLQHPPEELLKIFDRLHRGASIVVGYRSSFAGDYPRIRFAMSRLAASFARMRICSSVEQVRDPMSGLFGVRTEIFRKAWDERPELFELRGYKVLFDLLRIAFDERFPAKEPLRIAEVEYHFQTRKHGASKLSVTHLFYFLRSLLRR